MSEDPIIAEVHRTRDELSARFNYDVDAILADIRRRQVALGDRLVPAPKREPAVVGNGQNDKTESANLRPVEAAAP